MLPIYFKIKYVQPEMSLHTIGTDHSGLRVAASREGERVFGEIQPCHASSASLTA